jgi:hypothetical protein
MANETIILMVARKEKEENKRGWDPNVLFQSTFPVT